MKNLLVLILVFSIIFSGIMPSQVFGKSVDEKQMEKAVLKVKELFNISNDYDSFDSSISSYDGRVIFYLNWADTKEKLPNISIQVDSNGNIISFDKYYLSLEDKGSKLPNITKEEGQKLALEFIQKIDKLVFKEIKLIENTQPISTWDRYYSFIFTRIVDNILYPSNSVNINVDMKTGEITNLYMNWERDIVFPTSEGIISKDNAKKAYEKEIGLKLVYKEKNANIYRAEKDKTDNYFLVYSNLGENKGIDAKTGSSVNISYNSPYYTGGMADKEMGMGAGAPIITPEEREEIDKIKDLKSSKEAEVEARKLLSIDESYKLEREDFSSSWRNPNEYYYSLGFIKKIEEREYPIDISINAKTLEINSFYKYRDIAANEKANINKEAALKLAKDFIKKLNPDKINQIELLGFNEIKDNQTTYNFNFIRKVNDIYVESDYINIGVDAVNKEINSYNINWYKGEFPNSDNIIPISKAYEVLFNEIGIDLNYSHVLDPKKDENNQKSELRLIYSINTNRPMIIDAYSGAILDYSGELYKEYTIQNYDDIETSYAKDQIKRLAEYGVGFNSESFNPKEKIRQKDFIYLLWKSMNSYNTGKVDMEQIYKDLIRQRIIKSEEVDKEKIVTKEEAVKYVIKAMNYEKIAEISFIYKDIFPDSKDIDANLKGYMNLAYGLKIIEGDGTTYIRPRYELTREDAATVIYNYLFK